MVYWVRWGVLQDCKNSGSTVEYLRGEDVCGGEVKTYRQGVVVGRWWGRLFRLEEI